MGATADAATAALVLFEGEGEQRRRRRTKRKDVADPKSRTEKTKRGRPSNWKSAMKVSSRPPSHAEIVRRNNWKNSKKSLALGDRERKQRLREWQEEIDEMQKEEHGASQ